MDIILLIRLWQSSSLELVFGIEDITESPGASKLASFLVLRDVVIADDGYKFLQQHRQRILQCGTANDMAVDQTCDTVGQDKKIKTFDMAAQKLIRSYNHDKIFGEPVKVMMDPSCCTYVVCSFSNKSICIYDFITGEMVVKATGHAEIVTGVILPDCKHIVLLSRFLVICRRENQVTVKPCLVIKVSGIGVLTKSASDGISPSPPEVQIPSDHTSPLPDTLNSQDSSSFGGTCRNIPLDNHWHSIYTVCMEGLSSPEMQNLSQKTKSVNQTPFKFGRHKAVISEDKNSFGLNNLSKNEKSGVAPDQYVGCNNNDASWCSEEVSESKAEQLYLSESGSVSEITTDGNLSSLPSEEDMFKQHFGSLSNTHKVKSSNSLVRRFSAGYIVQWDCKKLFSSPVRNKVKENSVDKGSELGEIIMLLSVYCSYFKIRKCSYDKEVATGAVARKVNAVARLVQCRKNSKCESSRLSVQEMDQFGRFAEGRVKRRHRGVREKISGSSEKLRYGEEKDGKKKVSKGRRVR
ncbi:hypothetical protein JHK84_050921 [Glycine max]|nr:hypothetical protein JHK84_050921 [Glycine max]